LKLVANNSPWCRNQERTPPLLSRGVAVSESVHASSMGRQHPCLLFEVIPCLEVEYERCLGKILIVKQKVYCWRYCQSKVHWPHFAPLGEPKKDDRYERVRIIYSMDVTQHEALGGGVNCQEISFCFSYTCMTHTRETKPIRTCLNHP